MRERLARIVAVLLTATVALVAAFFAHRQNPGRAAGGRAAAPPAEAAPTPPGAAIERPVDPTLVERGRQVYEEQACARCHSIAGSGNPRSPLDGIGVRRTTTELGAWIVADESVRGRLSARVAAIKRGFAELPEADLSALVAYLSRLR